MDYMKNFFEMQKNMLDAFQESYSSMFESKEKNPYQKSFDDFANFYDMQKTYWENMKKMGDFYNKGFGMFDFNAFDFSNIHEAFNKYKEFYSSYDFSRFLDPNMSEVVRRMFDANKFYLQMYNFWKNLNDELLKNINEDAEKFKDFIETNANITYETLTSVLPSELGFLFGGVKDLAGRYFDTISSFYSPWKDEFARLRDLFMEGMLGDDPERIADFFRLWREKYDETFGKILNSPALGISREQIEQQNKMLDTLINVFIKSAEFSANLNAVQNDAFKKIIDEYIKATKEGMEIKTFEEFYNFWAKKMDQRLEEHFATEEFSKLLAQFGEAFMDFKIEYNKLIEFYFAESPVVTEGKIDSMIKSIYDLKKEVKALKKELEALKAAGAGKK